MKKNGSSTFLLLIISLFILSNNVWGQIRFTSTEITSTNQGDNYNYFITTNDYTGSVYIYSDSTPSWLQLTDNGDGTGSLTGISTQTEVGTHSITLFAEDDFNTVSQSFDIVVNNTNDTPHFTSTEKTAAIESELYTYNITTEDVDEDNVSIYASVALPTWLTITDNGNGTAQLQGTPSTSDIGTHHIVITVSDGSSSENQDFQIIVTNEKLIAHWKLDETSGLTASDELGNSNGTLTDMDGTEWESGYDGNAINFSSTAISSRISAPDNSALNFSNSNSYTISAMAYTDPITNTVEMTVVSKGSSAVLVENNWQGKWYGLGFKDSELRMYVDDNVNKTQLKVNISAIYPANEWVQIVGVRDRATDSLRLYLNGSIVGSILDITEDDISTDLLPFYIGNNAQLSQNFIGLLDDIRVYNYALDDTEVQALYDNTFSVNDAPVFTSTAATDVSQHDEYSYTITATDNNSDNIAFSADTVYTWLTFIDNTDGSASLTGTPDGTILGDFPITLLATDGIDTTYQSFTITVSDVNDAPSFTSTAITTGTQDIEYSYSITTEDLEDDDVTISALYPNWLSFTDNTDGTALLTGTPTYADTGKYDITLTVTDLSLSSQQEFTLNIANINDAPIFTSTPDTIALEDQAYSHIIIVEDLDGDSLQFTPVTLPTWLTLTDNEDGTANITGTPNNSNVGETLIEISVSDGIISENQQFDLTIQNVNDPPVINDQTDVSIIEDSLFVINLSLLNVTDVDNEYPADFRIYPQTGSNYSLIEDTIVPDTNYNGTLSINVQVSDGGVSDSISNIFEFALTVTPINDAPSISINAASDLNYTENDIATNFITDVTITDIDNTNIESASVRFLTGFVESEDILSISDHGNIVGNWNSNLGILTLNGSASLSTYETAIESITYFCDSENPSTLSKTVSITINDGSLSSNTATRNISITSVNDTPSTSDFTASTAESQSVEINLLNHVSDAEDDFDLNSITVTTNPLNGTTSINNNTGIITYTPATEYSGSDSFTYSICDNDESCGTGVVSITISNETPIVEDDNIETDEDIAVKINVLNNDSDNQDNIDNTSLKISVEPLHGTAEVVPDEFVILYTPDENYNGQDHFLYEICDLTSYCAEARVDITINAVNDNPSINDDNAITTEDTPITIRILDNDNDSNDPSSGIDASSLTITKSPQNGSISISSDQIIYTPDENYFGIDSFEYSVNDLGNPLPSLSETAEVTIQISSINDAPEINGQTSTSSDEDAPFTILAEYLQVIDVDNAYPDDFTIYVQAGNNYTVNGNVIQPNANYHGVLTIPLQVSDGELQSNVYNYSHTINPVNDKPIANNDIVYTGENTSINISLLSNDNDENDPLGGVNASSIQIITPAKHGSQVVFPNQTLNYSPYPGFYGIDTIHYSIADIGNPLPAKTDTAIIVIYVSRLSPVANNDNTQTDEDTDINISVLDNDTDSGNDINPYTLNVVTLPKNGSISVSNDGIISYTPILNFNGNDSLSYTVKDFTGLTSNIAKVFITVNPINDAPTTNNASFNTRENNLLIISLNEIASDIEDGLDFSSLSISTSPSNGYISTNATLKQIIYNPNSNFTGYDQFSFYIADLDGLESAISTASILVSNQAPIAIDDNYTIREDSIKEFNITGNDTDPQNNIDPTSVEILNNPTHGNVSVISETGNVIYEPETNYYGTDEFEYIIYDEDDFSDRAIVKITILPINDAPIINNDTIETEEDHSIEINTLLNDFDIDGAINVSSLTIDSDPIYGGVSINETNGIITYSPDNDFYGDDYFTYQVCDDSSDCQSATVYLHVIPVNDPPIAVDDIAQVIAKVPKEINVLKNDYSAEDDLDTASLKITTVPIHGIVRIQANGKIVFTSNNGFSGLDFFEYEICDNNGACDVARVNINIAPGNIAPVAIADYLITKEDSTTSISVIYNDYDQNNNLDTGSVTIVSDPKHGVIESLSDGTITYRPNDNYNGSDSIIYEICDNEGLCDQATIFITIDPVNDAPVSINDNYTTYDGSENIYYINQNDFDIDSADTLSYILTESPVIDMVTYSLSSTGVFSFTPNLGYNCTTLEFNYELCDQFNSCSTATISITINVTDSDNDGVSDYFDGQTDVDGDSIPNYLDTDSDNDNIPDSYESQISDTCDDEPVDSDQDGIPDMLDIDSDNDGKLDGDEGIEDCDDDGTLNYVDDIEDCDPYKVPDTFSPNNDGINDYFVIEAASDYPQNKLTIYNRSGSEVFNMTNYDNTWDGRSANTVFGNDILPEGTYFYILKLTISNQEEKVINGTVYIKH